MTATYRPGQLYTGSDGDLLFVVLPGDDIEFVTNRGTRVPLAEAERVYAPLTLVRDVTVERAAPADWPPRLGDVWRSHCEPLFATTDTGGLADIDQGKVFLANVAGTRMDPQTVLGHGPLTLVYREPAAPGTPAYPAPGSAIPGQPGYVVGRCGHRLTASEWRAGFRTCERCGGDWEDLGNGADMFACDHKTTDEPGHDNNACPRISEEQWQTITRGEAPQDGDAK